MSTIINEESPFGAESTSSNIGMSSAYLNNMQIDEEGVHKI
jgi:hypothetical protein